MDDEVVEFSVAYNRKYSRDHLWYQEKYERLMIGVSEYLAVEIGEVLRVMKDGRMMVAGINMVKKHKRPNPNTGDQGGIVPQEAPIQSSNIAIWNHESEKADKVGLRIEDGKKIRFFKSNGKEIED